MGSSIWLALLVLVLLAIILLTVIIQVPKRQVRAMEKLGVIPSDRRFELEDKSRGTLVQAIGGAFFLVTAYFSWVGIRQTEESSVVERFAKAAEQLSEGPKPGSKEVPLATHLGAIYTLGKISEEHEEYFGPVMEVLSAYVRQVRNRVPHDLPSDVPSEVMAALKVIGSRNRLFESTKTNIDLSYTDLHGAKLDHMNWSGVNFESARLDLADLTGSDLSEADLRQANFYDTILTDALLQNANLEHDMLDNTHGLTLRQIQTAKNYSHDILPEGIKGGVNVSR